MALTWTGDGAAVRAALARWVRRIERHRGPAQATIDGVAWSVSLVVATLLRYDFDMSGVPLRGVAAMIPLAAGIQTIAGTWLGLYTGRRRFGSFDEVAVVVRAATVTALVLFLVDLLAPTLLVARSVPLAAGALALVLMAGVRYRWRIVSDRNRRPKAQDCRRLLVFGAGEGAFQVITAMLRDPCSPFVPVALIDDDTAKRKLSIMGVPVVGGRQALAAAAGHHGTRTLLIAVPSASAALVTEISELAAAAGLVVKVLPPVGELFGDTVALGDIRDVSPADLLGRHEIRTDLDAIAGYLTGRRVMVTGAGGSIGSELCRQIYCYAPAELVMVDRDESALHAVKLTIAGRALLDSSDLVLVDLRDRPAVRQLLQDRRPHVVFHAAALKHLPLLERHPAEAVKTNVWATLDLLEAAEAAGVDRFVNISTDKAADPTSVLGYSKRIGEQLTAHVARRATGTYLSVRFGNVLGSRGSVLTGFQAQIEFGGPVTVTDPEVTRFFMTVEEAVQLVVQAGAIGGPGEILVLDMGEPVRIADVARLLISRARRDVSIEFTGLRPGEKLHEVLLGCRETDRRPVHPLISHVEAPPVDPRLVRRIDLTPGDPAAVVSQLRLVCAGQLDAERALPGR